MIFLVSETDLELIVLDADDRSPGEKNLFEKIAQFKKNLFYCHHKGFGYEGYTTVVQDNLGKNC